MNYFELYEKLKKDKLEAPINSEWECYDNFRQANLVLRVLNHRIGNPWFENSPILFIQYIFYLKEDGPRDPHISAETRIDFLLQSSYKRVS